MAALRPRAWQRLHLAGCLGVALLLLLELLAGAQAFYEGQVADWGFEAEPTIGVMWLRGGPALAPVLRADPDVDLRPGDAVAFPRVAQRWQPPAPGTRLQATRWRDGVASPLVLEARSRAFSPNERADYLLRLAVALPALLFSLLLGRAHAHDPGYRALALAFLGYALLGFLNFAFSTGHALGGLLHAAAFCALPPATLGVMRFALRFPQLAQSPWAPLLTRLRWPAGVLCTMAMLALAAHFAGWAVPGLNQFVALALGATQLLTVLALVAALARARGTLRNRTVWLLLALLLGLLPATLMAPLQADLQGRFAAGPAQWPLLALLLSQVASMLGLAYASLRHRMFDFELALNRTLVYGVAVLALLVVFAGLKKLVEPRLAALFFPGQDPRGHEVLNYALMVGTYIVGHLLFERIDHGLRHLLQHRRLHRLQRLRDFAERIPHFHGQEALVKALHAEIQHFSEGAGSVLYLRLAGGGFAPVAHGLPGAPHLLDADDPLLLRLRATPRPLRLDDDDGLASLALPLRWRSQLAGLLLVGPRRDHQAWQDEEIALLQQVVDQAHTDLQARAVERELGTLPDGAAA